MWVQVDPRFKWAIRVFDHRDWNVIGPIAERYGCYLCKLDSAGKRPEWAAYAGAAYGFGDTPQKAIALAVIGAKK